MADIPTVTAEQLALAEGIRAKIEAANGSAQDYAKAMQEAGLESVGVLQSTERTAEAAAGAVEYLKEQGASLSDINAKRQEALQLQYKALEILGKQNTEQGKLLKAKFDQISADQRLTKGAEQLTGILINSDWKNTMVGSFLEAENGLQSLVEGAKKNLTLDNLGGSAMMAMQEATMEMVGSMSSAYASLSQVTGTGIELRGVVADASMGAARLGVGMEQAAAATGTLYTNMSQFSSMNAETQTQLVKTTASLEKLGISGSQTAQNMNLATNSMGFSGSEAAALQEDMAKTAMAVGMPPAEMAAGFAKAGPQLAAYGKQGAEIFKTMAIAAKGLGVSMDTLLGLTAQFDTFEGAATAAGNLNSMLGGDLLNSMEMMNASGDDQVRMLLQAVDASGKNWDSMNKFERKQLAAAAGISDMAEAAALFGGGLSAFDDAQAKAEENAVSQAEMESAMAASVSMQEQMKLIMGQLAVAVTPLVNGIQAFLGGVLYLNDAFGGFLLPTLVGGIAVIWMIYKGMMLAKGIQTAWTAATVAFSAAGGASSIVKAAMAAANTATAVTAGPAAAGEVAIGTGAWYAAIPVAILALGIGLLALGIGLLAIAIAAIVWAFVYLIQLFMEAPLAALAAAGALLVFGLVIAFLTPIFAVLAPIAPLAMAAMIMLGVGLVAMGVGMMFFGIAAKLGAGELIMMLPALAVALAIAAPLLLMAGLGLLIAGIFLLPGAIMVGMGLMFLAMGVAPWMAMDFAKVMTLGATLDAMTDGFTRVGFWLMIAGPMLMIGGMTAGIGLLFLALGVAPFMAMPMDKVMILGHSLKALGQGLFWAGMALGVAGPLILAGASALVPALLFLLVGIAPWMVMDPANLVIFGNNLLLMAQSLLPASILMFMAAAFMFPAAIVLSIGLLWLAIGFTAMGLPTVALGMQNIVNFFLPVSLMLFMGAPFFLAASWMLYAAAFPFFVGSLFIAMGMTLLWLPMILFSFAMAAMNPWIPSLIPLAAGLMALAPALLAFGFAVFMLGVFAMTPFFSIGMFALVWAIESIGKAMGMLDASALGAFVTVLDKLTEVATAGSVTWYAMSDLAAGIRRIAYALDSLPTSTMIAFGVSAAGFEAVGDMATKVTPASAVNIGKIVDEAQRYVEVQAEMKYAWNDPFVRLMEASAAAESSKAEAAKASAEGGGQDVVLVLNERELGRAVEAILNKKMNLSVS
jgi:hypothetical protein